MTEPAPAPAPAPEIKEEKKQEELKVGAKMPDGTIYAGISPETEKPMYVTPADATLAMTFKQAKEYAKNLDSNGHKDWRVPTKRELNEIFNNRAAIEGLNLKGSGATGPAWYWAKSSQIKALGYVQRFSDGARISNIFDLNPSSLRCVR